MDESTEWSETERALYVAGIPLLALVAVLMLFGIATSSSRHASAAASPAKVDMSPEAVAERARKEQLEERRDMYFDCLEAMGVNVRGFASRFSRPSREKIRIASGVCSTLMRGGTALTPPRPQRAPVPNTL
jgi:hypothetical protein